MIPGVGLWLLAGVSAGWLSPSNAAASPAQLTVQQAIAVRRPSDLHWSPDGSRLAFVLSEPAKGASRQSHIWVYEAASGEIRQFTNSPKSERQPRWSPDGTRLAFLSDRGEHQQIYVMPVGGGEARALTRGKRSIERFEWSPDGKGFACLAPEEETDDDTKQTEAKDDARSVDRDDKPAHLWIGDAESGALRQLAGGLWKFEAVQWMPDGEHVIVVATDHPEVERHTNRIFRLSIADPHMDVLDSPRGPFGNVRVVDGGAAVSYIGSRIDGPEPHDLYVHSIADGRTRNLTASAIDRPVKEYALHPDGRVHVLCEEGFRDTFWTIDRSGHATRTFSAGMAVDAADLSRSGRIAFVGENADRFPEIWISDGTAAPRRVSNINQGAGSAPLTQVELITYRSFDGRQIQAGLLRPTGQTAPAATVVLVHGGPTGAWRDTFESWGQLLAAAGYAVFYPNVRGSTGYGHEFMVLNRADWGGGDFKDLMAGVDDLVAKGIADPQRLGIGGWSYGGYMASWAITQTPRFKAAVSGAGMADLAAEFSTEDNPAYDEWFYGLPYEQPEGFRRSSPLTFIKNARTPTLILQGEADVIDPPGQSQALYRALKKYDVPTELVLYPREGHGLLEEKHLLDRLTRIVAWFDRYVKS